MNPMNAFLDAIWKANHGYGSYTYTFESYEDAKSFCSSIKSTGKVTVTDWTARKVEVEFA